LATCQYKYNEFLEQKVDFTSNEEASTGSAFCIFHDENYVKDHYEEFEHEATKRFDEKVRESISDNKPLGCIGYHLPAIEFAKYFTTTTFTEKRFSQPVYFIKAKFCSSRHFKDGIYWRPGSSWSIGRGKSRVREAEIVFCEKPRLRARDGTPPTDTVW
jgi:hypothetical protein